MSDDPPPSSALPLDPDNSSERKNTDTTTTAAVSSHHGTNSDTKNDIATAPAAGAAEEVTNIAPATAGTMAIPSEDPTTRNYDSASLPSNPKKRFKWSNTSIEEEGKAKAIVNSNNDGTDPQQQQQSMQQQSINNDAPSSKKVPVTSLHNNNPAAILNNQDDNTDDSDEEDGPQSTVARAPAPARSVPPARGTAVEMMDGEDVNLEAEEGDHEALDDDMLRRIVAAAEAQGIPLEFLVHMHGMNNDDDPNEVVDYPFDHPPQSLKDVAEFIQSDKCRKIVLLAGAGMSVASGIPDFRSSNGLYATLQADRLTADEIQKDRIRSDPSYSLDQHLFLENPLPCLEVNREFVLGMQARKWKATLAHRFVELLYEKTTTENKFCRLYTQNIDGLEDQCGLPHSKRIAVHGSMDEAVCAICHHAMDWNEFCRLMKYQIKDITGQDTTAPATSSPILCLQCHMPAVKPNIVLFRSSLPKDFFRNVPTDTKEADLLIVLGTSLGVAPANSLVWRVPKSCMRVVINREPVGWHLGFNSEHNDRDYFGRGNCENVVLELMKHLGWLDDLRPLLEAGQLPPSSAELLQHVLEKEQGQEQEQQKEETAQNGITEVLVSSSTAKLDHAHAAGAATTTNTDPASSSSSTNKD